MAAKTVTVCGPHLLNEPLNVFVQGIHLILHCDHHCDQFPVAAFIQFIVRMLSAHPYRSLTRLILLYQKAAEKGNFGTVSIRHNAYNCNALETLHTKGIRAFKVQKN